MEAQELTVLDLFGKQVRYLVPDYQRSYVWSQEEQWEPLWNDISGVADAWLSPTPQTPGGATVAHANRHFLGAVVLKQEPTDSKTKLDIRRIVDGQQRLTTLQLLLDAAYDVYQSVPGPAADRLRDLIRNRDSYLPAGQPDQAFKVRPSEPDRPSFRQAMTIGDRTEVDDEDVLESAHEFFRAQIREWLERDPANREERAAALETVLTDRLEMVVIDLANDDDEQTIFETLNARGTPLEQSELIRNYILQMLDREGTPQSGVLRQSLDQLRDRWWQQEVGRGRLRRPRVDAMVAYWLTARQQREVAPASLFKEFRAEHQPVDVSIRDLILELDRHAGHYRAIETLSDESDFGVFLRHWRVISVAAITPALFTLLDREKDPLQLSLAVRTLESLLVRRMIMRLSTRQYTELAIDLVRAIEGANNRGAGDAIVSHLRAQRGQRFAWPSDGAIAEALRTSPLYRLLTRARTRMLLRAIEQRMRSAAKTESSVVSESISIEHVMPQRWTETYPPPDAALGGGNPDEAIRVRNERLIHTIGNLTLVSSRVNPSMSNGAWGDKRKALAEHSTLFLNKALLKGWHDAAWDDDAIQERSSQLADFVIAVWPGPDSDEWTA